MLRLRTFGGLTFERDGVSVDEIVPQRKLLALLAVLARSGDAGIGRERLMALLWTDSDMVRARGALKQMIHTLRRQLAPDVVIGTSELRLNRDVVSSDVADFTELIGSGRREEAVQHYRGPFLDGVHIERAPDFSRWQDAERAELHRTFIDALESLAASAEAERRYDEATTWWLRFSVADPLHARGVLGVMRSLDLAGDRAGALRHAQIHEDLLKKELGAKADPDVAALAARMRAMPASSQSTVANSNGGRAPIHAVADPPDLRGTRDSDKRTGGSQTADGPGKASAETMGVDRTVRAGRRRRWLFVGGLVAALTAAAVIPSARDRQSTAPAGTGKRTVVALFTNQTGDSTLDALQLLAADWMTREVASTPGVDMLYPGVLYVQGKSASGTPTSPLQLARNNGANLAVAGNYFQSNDTLFFSASIIDVATGRVLRVLESVPASRTHPLEGIEALRQKTSVALQTILDPRVSGFVSASTRTPRLDAYREFLIGEELHWRGDMRGALPHFARAGQLDPSFLLVAARMAITAGQAGRCDLVDSIAAATAGRLAELSEMERPAILSTVAACNEDWNEVVRISRERVGRQPEATMFHWVLAAFLRRTNRPAEAAAILKRFDADHDLGWLVPPRRLFFWRELTSAQHAIGDYRGERKSADAFAHAEPGGVMARYYKARSFAGEHEARAALMMVDSIEGMQSGPVLVGRQAVTPAQPVRAATTGWALYGLSEELLAHGHPVEAKSVATRAVRWFETRTDPEKKTGEYRLILARALTLMGEYEEPYRLLAALVAEDSANIDYRAGFGRVAALRGDTATARRIASSLLPVPGERRAPRILARAQIAAALGDSASAFSLLESLPAHVHPSDFLLFHSDPAFAALRQSARFKAFIRPRG